MARVVCMACGVGLGEYKRSQAEKRAYLQWFGRVSHGLNEIGRNAVIDIFLEEEDDLLPTTPPERRICRECSVRLEIA